MNKKKKTTKTQEGKKMKSFTYFITLVLGITIASAAMIDIENLYSSQMIECFKQECPDQIYQSLPSMACVSKCRGKHWRELYTNKNNKKEEKKVV